MNEAEWDQHYRARALEMHDEGDPQPDTLVARIARAWPASSRKRALELACGAGSNALWLAEHGWEATAVDRSPAAISLLESVAQQRKLKLRTHVADLEAHAFAVEPGAWDLILMCRYLQRDLWEPAIRGLAPGGVLIIIVLLDDTDASAPKPFRARAGELIAHFKNVKDCEILYQCDAAGIAGKAAVTEIAVRKTG